MDSTSPDMEHRTAMGCPEFLRKAGECEDKKDGGRSPFAKLWNDARQELDKAIQGTDRQAQESGQQVQRQVQPKLDELMRETDKAVRDARSRQSDLARKAEQAGKDIEGAIFGGLEKLTKVDAAELEKNFSKNMDKLDKDRDGFVTREELDKANDDLIFRITNAHMLKVLTKHDDTLQSLSNDEWGFENSGITLKDIQAARELTKSGLGFSTLVGSAFKTAFSGETLTAAGVLTAGGIATTLGSKALFGAASRVPLIAGLGLAAGAIGVSGVYGALEHQLSRKPKLE